MRRKPTVQSAIKKAASAPRLSMSALCKLLEEGGSKPGNYLPSSGGGGLVICGIGPALPTREQRVKEFTRHLKLMAKRAQKGDAYIVFEVQDDQGDGRGGGEKTLSLAD
jgi:hypothetical protein